MSREFGRPENKVAVSAEVTARIRAASPGSLAAEAGRNLDSEECATPFPGERGVAARSFSGYASGRFPAHQRCVESVVEQSGAIAFEYPAR